MPALLVLLAALLLPVQAAHAAEPAHLSALRCAGDLAGERRGPVLLIHGTGVQSEENWSWGYERALRRRGHGVCMVDLPVKATVDLQDSLPYTVSAIRETHRRGGARPIAIVGHSQGATQAVMALRIWPELGALVDDVVGLAGAYDHGSQKLADRCAESGCTPPFWQLRPGSDFLRAVAGRPLPRPVSVTAIGTLHDTTVTPQPHANEVAGGRSIQLQDLCPRRRFVPDLDHIYLAADNVAYRLAVDALDHRGPADPARIPRSACDALLFPDADLVGLAAISPSLAQSLAGAGNAGPVPREPALRCPLAAGCASAAGAAAPIPVTGALRRRGRRIVLRVTAPGRTQVRVRFTRRTGGRVVVVGATRSRTVGAGATTVQVPASACRVRRGHRSCRRLAAGRVLATLQARRGAAAGWTVLARRTL